jgi:predicted metalloprotease
MSPGGMVAGGGIGVVILAVVVMLLGGDPSQLLGAVQSPAGQSQPVDPAQEPLREFVAVTLADTEEVWSKLFADMGLTYKEPRLVLFSGQVQSACGMASDAVGPFYCGEDQQIYIDLGFYETLRSQLGAKGDFAQAYVIAHEVGHHVQNLLGTLGRVNEARRRVPEREANQLSVRLELQADYYAGVWAHHARQMAGLDRGDIEEAVEAAEAIGDDNLMRKSQGTVVPDAFTHGTSEQRVRWFLAGFESGDPRGGDTFQARRL